MIISIKTPQNFGSLQTILSVWNNALKTGKSQSRMIARRGVPSCDGHKSHPNDVKILKLCKTCLNTSKFKIYFFQANPNFHLPPHQTISYGITHLGSTGLDFQNCWKSMSKSFTQQCTIYWIYRSSPSKRPWALNLDF